MTIGKINSFFEQAGRFQVKYRVAFLIVLAAFTAFGLAGLSRFKLKIDDSSWIAGQDEVKKADERYKEIFGNEQYIAVLVQADDVFDPRVLSAINDLSRRLLLEVPFANQVTSLTTLSISRGTADGIDVSNPFKNGIPGGGKPLSQMTDGEKKSLAEKKTFLMSRSSLVNTIVSDDCRETWVLLSLLPYADKDKDPYTISAAAIRIVDDPEFQSNPAFTMKGAGSPYTACEEENVIQHETLLRILSGFIVMLICLVFLVRSVRGVVITVTASLLGIAVVFGFSGWLGIAGNEDFVTLPVMLSMALSIGYALHFINSFQLEQTRMTDRKKAVIEAVKKTGWPILFTVLTTVASFISFVFSGIKPLIWLGGVSSAAVISVYLYVVMLLPVIYSFGKDTPAEGVQTSERRIRSQKRKNEMLLHTDEMYGKAGRYVLAHRVPILVVSAVIVAVSIGGLFKIRVNQDTLTSYGVKIPFIRRTMDVLHSKLGNEYSYNIMIEYPDADAFKDPEKVKALDVCAERLGKLRLTKVSGGKPRVSSVTGIIKEMNRTLNGDDIACYSVPEDPDLLSQLLFLYEISGGTDLATWVSDDYSTSHITIDVSRYESADVLADINDAQRIGTECFPGAKVTVLGDMVENARINSLLVTGQVKSLGVSFIIIAAMMILAFSSFRTGLIDMLPNIAPVLLAGGVLGYCGYSLDLLLMTAMPMILGIAVDDTIHFTNHVKSFLEQGKSYYDAIILTYKEIGRSMASSTVILCLMFLMYMFSPMNSLFRIGMLSIIGLGSALIADYTLTPILLYITKPLGKETNGLHPEEK